MIVISLREGKRMKLLAIDGNSIANRAFYGIKALANKKGEFTNAIVGFMNIYLKNFGEIKPDKVAVAFDLHAPTFRHKAVESYKANRHGMPEELQQQMPKIKDLLRSMGISVLEEEGWEADDILGTLARLCEENGDECCILTGDRDSLQLITEKTTVYLVTTKETVKYTPDVFGEKYGFAPRSLIDLKALMGDSSDNIPGVKGIGEKTAMGLIQKFGTIEALYADLDNSGLKPAALAKITAGVEDAKQSKWLATIVTDVPIGTLGEALAAESDPAETTRLLSGWEMFAMIEKLSKLGAAGESSESGKKEEVSFKEENFTDIDFTDSIIYYFLYDKELSVHFGESVSKTSDEGEILRFFTSDCKKVTCFAKGAYKFCFERGETLRGIIFDVEIAAYLLSSTPSEPSVERFSREYSVAGCSAGEWSDVGTLPKLYEKLSADIKEAEMDRLMYEVELPLCEVLASMETHGVLINREGVVEFGEMLRTDIAGLEEQIYFMAGKKFNISSPKQLGEVLFEEMGLPSGKKTKTGYSTNADVLEELRDKHPIVDMILRYRQLTKLSSTYVDGLLRVISDDGRIHSNFKQTETRTGRISSTDPNMQNIPVRTELGSNMRKFFRAPDGYVLLDADYSQIELRIVAALCDDENMKSAFIDGRDIHTTTASQVFNMPEDMVTPSMRRTAKAVNFGIIYGIGSYSLSKDIGVTMKKAGEYITNYYNNFPKMKKFMDDTVSGAVKNGYVTTILGRRRYIPELYAANKTVQAFGKRAAMNAPVQGSAADVIKIAMVRVYQRLREEKLDARLILQVHDELIVEASEKDKVRAAEILGHEMENAVKLSVPLTAEVNEGKSWYDAKG